MSGRILSVIVLIHCMMYSNTLTAQMLIIDTLPSNVEKMSVIFKTAEWFGVQKFTIEGYARGKFKTGIKSNSVDNNYGVGGSKTTYKCSISILSDSLGTVTVTGNVEIIEFYETPSAGQEVWTNFKSSITGIESETIPGRISFKKMLNASITTKNAEGETGDWFLTLYKTDYTVLDSSTASFIRNGDRKIDIFQPPPVQKGNDAFRYDVYSQRYDFVEEGRSLGAVDYDDENIIMLRKDLEPSLKLTLMAAMISLQL